MNDMTAWILGEAPGDFISPALLKRIEGDCIAPMDQAIARENLKLFKRIMDEQQAVFCLFFGTLLGAIREGDFITHDYDTDVVVMEEDRRALARAAPRLAEAGFELVRSKDHGRFITFMRKGEFIDVYVAKKDHRFPLQRCWNIDGSLVPRPLLADFMDFPFLEESFRIPRRYEEIFFALYGADWRTPKRNCPSYTPFDIFHPYRSAVLFLKKYLPRETVQWLKHLIKRS